MTVRLTFALFFCALSVVATAQLTRVKGVVIDQVTREPLAFVNFAANDGRKGTTSNLDGSFELLVPEGIQLLRVSYVGYETQTIEAKKLSANMLLSLVPTSSMLNEVVVSSKDNPALRIIALAAENRKRNHPENLPSFSYKSYNKFVVDVALSDEMRSSDDSAAIRVRGFVDKQYLFLVESVTERQYLFKGRNNEVVLANRVSGLQNPTFTTLANSFQPFSFYENVITILGKDFVNPISQGSTSKYFFTLEDEFVRDNDSIFVVSFSPKNLNFDGMKGVLYINANQYAIQNVIAETADSVSGVAIRIQQQYAYLPEARCWFPSQIHTDLTFGKNLNLQTKGGKSIGRAVGIGRTYLSEVKVGVPLKASAFDRTVLEFSPTANDFKDDTLFWNKYRTEIDYRRAENTYVMLDSVGKKAKLDQRLTGFTALMSGSLPIGKVQFDLNRLISVNEYENLRLGLGLHTSKKFSQRFSIGGYFGYGFRDKAWKYGGDAALLLRKRNELKLGVRYMQDIAESGGSAFYLDNMRLGSDRYRNVMIRNMDKVALAEVKLNWYMLKYLDTELAAAQINKTVTSSYRYVPTGDAATGGTDSLNSFDFYEVRAGFKYAFREEYVSAFGSKVSTGTRYPVIWLNVARGFADNLQVIDYWKFELKVQKTFRTLRLGKPSFQLTAGRLVGNAPYPQLFNIRSSFSRTYFIESANSFQTMRLNEFAADRYIALHYRHTLGQINIKPDRSQPEFTLTASAGFGDLKNTEKHADYNFKTMNKGFYETGLVINHIYKTKNNLSSFGLGVFYRLGDYAFAKWQDNLALKLSIAFGL